MKTLGLSLFTAFLMTGGTIGVMCLTTATVHLIGIASGKDLHRAVMPAGLAAASATVAFGSYLHVAWDLPAIANIIATLCGSYVVFLTSARWKQDMRRWERL